MKKVLLTLAALTAVSIANAQQTYNYFDPADCDADGWLWFDTQEKLEKYCGFENEGKKVILLSAVWENSNGDFEEPTLDGNLKGYNAEGKQGEEGSWTGAISLSPNDGKLSYGGDNPIGGGIMLQLPDIAEYSLALSTENDLICLGLYGSVGIVPINDCSVIQIYTKMGWINTALAKVSQFKWNDIQNVTNKTNSFKLPTAKGKSVTSAMRNNSKYPLLVQGIRLFTYTQTEYPAGGASVGEIGMEDSNAPVEFFNMQGVKVSGDEPGLYIPRQGSKVEKVIKK